MLPLTPSTTRTAAIFLFTALFRSWALTLALFIPIVVMMIVLLIPKAEENLIKVVTLLTTLLTAAVGIGILANFNVDDGRLQFTANERWIDVINSRYHEIGRAHV